MTWLLKFCIEVSSLFLLTGRLLYNVTYLYRCLMVFTGKSIDELMAIWKTEADAVLSSKVIDGLHVDVFKVLAERKVSFYHSYVINTVPF